jgi:hypothetical protein
MSTTTIETAINSQSLSPVATSPELANALAKVQCEEQMFELAQRRAKVYASSTLVPKEYQGNLGNVMVAMNMASRLNADAMLVMQNLYIVHGRPGWSSQFLIATFNSCGRFSTIKYRFTGERGKSSWGCVAYTTEIATGEVVEGTEITIEIAKAEGWVDKNGSKWKTFPEQMLRYRAAAFLIRTIAPEVSMGFVTKEEAEETDGEAEYRTSISRVRVAPLPELVTERVIDVETNGEEFERSARVRGQYLEQLSTTVKIGALKSLMKDAAEDELLSEADKAAVVAEIEERIVIAQAT